MNSAFFNSDVLMVALLFAAWSLAAFRFPRQMVIVLPLFFPLYLVKFRVGGFPVTMVEIFVVASSLRSAFSFQLLASSFRSRAQSTAEYGIKSFLRKAISSKLEARSWNQLAAISFVAFLLSLFVTPHEFLVPALGIVKSWFLIPILYFFLLAACFSPRQRGVQSVRSFDFYCLSAVFLAGWGIFQYVSGSYITPDMRASGPFESANYLAFYLAPAAMYCFLMFLQHVRNRAVRRMSIFYFLSALVLFFALYQTKSFGAFLGILAGFFAYFVLSFSGRPHFWKKLSAVFVLIFFVGGIFFATGDSKKFDALFRFDQQSSSAVRLQVWKVAGHFIAEHPVLGIGLGTFQKLYEKNAAVILGAAPYETTMLHPHNVFLMFWLSAGLLGFLSFLFLLGLFFTAFFHLPPDKKFFGMILFALMIAILVHGLVDTPIWKNDLALVFSMICAGMFGMRGGSHQAMKLTGTVVSGLGLGRQFGFPTLNLEFDTAPSLDYGVYACRARAAVGSAFLPALLHFGLRPTIDREKPSFEVFFLKFPEGVDMKTLEVEVLGKLRDVMKFSSMEALGEQIERDREQAMVEYFRAEFPAQSHF